MALEVTAASILAFIVTVGLLIIYSIKDVQERKVPNNIMGVGFVVGFLSGFIFWHIINQLYLHITAFIIVFLITFLLFRIKAVGGADVKAALTIAIISPGIEFTAYENYMFEGFVGATIQLFVMLLLGYLYYLRNRNNAEREPAPLILFLLIGYLIVQLFALV